MGWFKMFPAKVKILYLIQKLIFLEALLEVTALKGKEETWVKKEAKETQVPLVCLVHQVRTCLNFFEADLPYTIITFFF
jgi:hypothetical protein